MYDWIEPDSIEVPDTLRDFVGGHPLVAQILVRRGITTVEAARAFMNPDAYTPAPASDLPDLLHAVERVESAIAKGERIVVWGDFDVDGQTSTSLFVDTLRELGADVIYHIPVRAEESHGVNIANLAKLLDAGARLILTCDTGVSAHEAVAYAAARDVEMIITDHHELPPELPQAYAVVNPHRLPEGHPLGALPGVGVAYKVAEALYQRAGQSLRATRHLDLVALGVVADVAEQVGDTRYLLQQGLEVLRHTERVGLQALAAVAQLDLSYVTEEDIGFALGPRLNALGRLADANESVRLLTTDDLSQARILASQLEVLNERRKQLCEDVLQGAEGQLAQDPSILESAALVLANSYWPAGVIGIVASRLVEKYNRPVILLATPEGEMARGSARSVEGCDITAAIATQRDLLEQFGGHRMAAGLSLSPDQIPAFRQGLSQAVMQQLGKRASRSSLHLDGYVSFSELSLDLLRDFQRLAPFGAGNSPPILAARGVKLLGTQAIGRNGEHFRLIVEDASGVQQEILWWRGMENLLPEGRFDLAYSLSVNTYLGTRQLQITWVDARQEVSAGAVLQPAVRTLDILDYRKMGSPLTLLQELLEQESENAFLQLWAEVAPEVEGQPRSLLEPAEILIIWTIPPGPLELQDVLSQVSPQRVALFAADPDMDSPSAFLGRLSGLIKYAVNQQGGHVKLLTLAEATAQRQETVRKGLSWLQAKGYLTIVEDLGDTLEIRLGGERSETKLAYTVAELKALLEETAAYRRYFVEASSVALFD